MQTEKTPIISKDKDELKAALEAILFISGEAVSHFRLANTLNITSDELDELIMYELVGHIVQVHDLDGFGLCALIGLHRHLFVGEDVLRQGDDGGVLGLVEGQHIIGRHPAHCRQQGGDTDDEGHIQQCAQQTEALFLPPSSGRGALALLPGQLAPSAGASSFLL